MSNWQTIVVLSVVIASAAALLLRTLRWIQGTGANGCGACSSGGCSVQKNGSIPANDVKFKPLMQIQLPGPERSPRGSGNS